jgi:hemerythrin-like domain-containing protein
MIMIRKPIKRNKHIAALSKDHHNGLLLCWKIRQGLKLNVSLVRIRAYINFFWQTHMVEHFRQEEVLLFDKVDASICRLGLDEHEIIRLLVNDINRGDNHDTTPFVQLAKMIEQHIRYEERILFPHLEAVLNQAQLEAIGTALDQHNTVEQPYADPFWIAHKTAVMV